MLAHSLGRAGSHGHVPKPAEAQGSTSDQCRPSTFANSILWQQHRAQVVT